MTTASRTFTPDMLVVVNWWYSPVKLMIMNYFNKQFKGFDKCFFHPCLMIHCNTFNCQTLNTRPAGRTNWRDPNSLMIWLKGRGAMPLTQTDTSTDFELTTSRVGQQMHHNVSKSHVVDKLVSGCKQTLVHVIPNIFLNNSCIFFYSDRN